MPRHLRWISITALGAVLLGVHLSLYQYAYDDAYIHFRIARNAALFGRPYYNLDEAVMATSSPLWTALLWVISLLTGAVPVAMAVLNAIFTVLAATTWSRLGTLLLGRERGLDQLLITLGVTALLLTSSIGLMETPLAMLLLGRGILEFIDGRPRAFAILTFAAFTRPELSLFVLTFGLENVFEKRMPLGRVLAAIASVAVPLMAALLYFYGTVVPHTLLAKSVVYSAQPFEFVQILLRSMLGEDLVALHRPVVLLWAAALFFALLVAVLSAKPHGSLPNAPLRTRYILLPALFTLFAYGAHHALVFPWYVPVFMLPILFAALVVAHASDSKPIWALAALLALPFLGNLLRTLAAATVSPGWYVDFASGARVRSYLALSRELATRTPSADAPVLMSSEIGGLGYGYPGKVEDALGLASPSALRFHPLKVPDERGSGIVGAIPLPFVKLVKPGIIVSMDLFFPGSHDPWVSEHYSVEKRPLFLAEDAARLARSDLWGNSEFLIFTRKDTP